MASAGVWLSFLLQVGAIALGWRNAANFATMFVMLSIAVAFLMGTAVYVTRMARKALVDSEILLFTVSQLHATCTTSRKRTEEPGTPFPLGGSGGGMVQ